MKFAAILLFGSILMAQEFVAAQGSRRHKSRGGYYPSYHCTKVALRYQKKFGIEQWPIINIVPPTRHTCKITKQILGCKQPFHYGVFSCCRAGNGDCSETVRKNMRSSALSFKNCMESGKYGDNYVKCWIEAEAQHACSRSHFSAGSEPFFPQRG